MIAERSRRLGLVVLSLCLVSHAAIADPNPLKGKNAATVSPATQAGRTAFVKQISQQVRAIEARAKQYRRESLNIDIEGFLATAYLSGQSLRKVVMLYDAFDCWDAREWYFEDGKPIFLLVSWYQGGSVNGCDKNSLLSQERYYFKEGRVIRTTVRSFGETTSGDSCATRRSTADELRAEVKAIRDCMAKPQQKR